MPHNTFECQTFKVLTAVVGYIQMGNAISPAVPIKHHPRGINGVLARLHVGNPCVGGHALKPLLKTRPFLTPILSSPQTAIVGANPQEARLQITGSNRQDRAVVFGSSHVPGQTAGLCLPLPARIVTG